jgi:hypothetical protein
MGGWEDVVMKRAIVVGLVAALVAGTLAEPEARPRRPRKSVEYYTFSAQHLEERVADYVGKFPRVIVVNEFSTKVMEGMPIPRLAWSGRRIDVLLEDVTSTVLEVPLPRGAQVEEIRLYLIEPNGRDGKRVKKPDTTVEEDTLRVKILELGEVRVIDLQYRLEGAGVTVDESFLFQPDWPVLRSEYSFSVSRELWQEAANQGLAWEFSAQTEPRTWQPNRDDSPEFYTWYWRLNNAEPVDPNSSFTTARAIVVTGYLPAPALAGFDPEELPNLKDFEDILAFESRLQQTFDDESQSARTVGASGAMMNSNTSGPVDVPAGGNIGK